MKVFFRWIDGYKTYMGVWLLMILTLSIMGLMVVYETQNKEAWGIIKYLVTACVGTLGWTVYGLRDAMKKQENFAKEIKEATVGRVRGEGPAPQNDRRCDHD